MRQAARWMIAIGAAALLATVLWEGGHQLATWVRQGEFAELVVASGLVLAGTGLLVFVFRSDESD